MVHYFTIFKGVRDDLDNFYYWLTSRRYRTTHPNQLNVEVQPNVREIRFYDISVPESCIGQLLTDLSPYNKSFTDNIGTLSFSMDLLRLAFQLDPVAESGPGYITDRWREYMHVMIVGQRLDPVVNGVEMI